MPTQKQMLEALGIGPWTPTQDLIEELQKIPDTAISTHLGKALDEAILRLMDNAGKGDYDLDEIRGSYEAMISQEPLP